MYTSAPFGEVNKHEETIEVLDLTTLDPGMVKTLKNRPAIEFGAVTPGANTIPPSHDLPRRAENTTTKTALDAVKTGHIRTALLQSQTPNLTSDQTNDSRESGNKSSETTPLKTHQSLPPTSTSKRSNPFIEEDENETKDSKATDTISVKKRRLTSTSQSNENTAPSPSPSPSTPPAPNNTTTTTPTQPLPLSFRRHAHIRALHERLAHERRARRRAERRLAAHTHQVAPLTRVAARLARWVVDMYAAHGRREEEVEEFLGELREDAGEGPEGGWERLVWLGGWLGDGGGGGGDVV
ncbi:uncharacterized protein BKCO1_2400075 [Diplodia corticola]|uniref:Uncharacterized protein n=1 Tax=Diplodia corticola TaxID=236234 RepID=A0A1J9S2K3_9PEZI|nr:uncharacterized protein BKCO1_2400075 [Diplodia corticola]OJD34236.1 hypothetical protein BKCO1_2400075 [Diplodia corticola]